MENLTTASASIPTARKEGDALLLAIHGELDLHNSPELRGNLLDLINANRPRRLILDMSMVPYMDSSALAVLVEMLKRLLKSDGKILLWGLQPRVRGLLEIARLATIFTISKDEADALSR